MTGNVCEDDKVKVCGSGCSFDKDGRCDDGGPGSRYDSCTFGSDCDDCGPREQPCGAAAKKATSYEYDEKREETPPSPPPHQCTGGGKPRCNTDRCNMFLHPETTDCGHCE